MTNDLAAGVTWVQEHKTRKNVPGAKYRIGYGWSWSQLCVALVYWALGATHTWDSAAIALEHSTIVSKTRTPPDGAIGWFELGSAGHVGFFKGGLLYSATKWASNLGTALGTLTIAEYERLSGAKWIGWGWDFGGQTFANLSIESITTTTRQEDTMLAIEITENPVATWKFLIGWGGLKNAPDDQADQHAFDTGQQVIKKDLAAMAVAIYNAGLADQIPAAGVGALLFSLSGGKQIVGSWFKSNGGASACATKADVQAISDASDKTVVAAIGKIPAAPTKFEAAA